MNQLTDVAWPALSEKKIMISFCLDAKPNKPTYNDLEPWFERRREEEY